MCGIAGSSNPNTAFKLYQSNLNRGYYSSGYEAIDSGVLRVGNWYGAPLKKEGIFESAVQVQPSLFKYHLYHSRGPTVETKEFVPENNHPFQYGDWMVAHNGIISNFDELCKKYFPQEDFTGKTDSCIIPRLLSLKPSIMEALEELKGTFALWIYNCSSRKIYLARSSSTLFANIDNGDFCSTYFEGSVSLREGLVYEIKDFLKITEISNFKTDSPYLIL